MDIWSACKDAVALVLLEGELIRVVESQEQIATNSLVDNLAEQAQLEEMLETSKPPPHPDTARLHYLLSTPFRYPPLQYGSRFGGAHEPSIFYGSLAMRTALAETAFYRLIFWYGMEIPPPSGKLLTQHTAFGASYRTSQGLQLQHPPFASYQSALTDPTTYEATQSLGQSMRNSDVSAFEYVSARDIDKGLNIAIYTPEVFSHPAPNWQQPLLCETRTDGVGFTGKNIETMAIGLDEFLVSGTLPSPCT